MLPRGTILRMTGTFDNSPANRNVVDPRNWSGMGHRSIDNMMNVIGGLEPLTEDEFWNEIANRRATLELKEGQKMLGCPMRGYSKRPTALPQLPPR